MLNYFTKPTSLEQSKTLISLDNITKSFKEDNTTNMILNNISFHVQENQTLSVIGSSGSGKTTFLNIIDGIEKIDSGQIIKRDNIKINYVTQQAHFIDELDIYNNLYLVTLKDSSNKNIESYCNYFQCSHLLKKKPRNLSGGEKQRVNLIRSLLSKPDLLILDEPTAALDYENKLKVVHFLNELREKETTSIIIVTHDQDVLDLIEHNQKYLLKNKSLQLI